ncbi:MAG: hypothetical protein GX631_08885 [Dehalococcoidales bacterium]|nr:hypothetical protein [Dehalococcoidales bacterium]
MTDTSSHQPFKPNNDTIAAMQEAERIARNPNTQRYSDVEEALRKLKNSELQ